MRWEKNLHDCKARTKNITAISARVGELRCYLLWLGELLNIRQFSSQGKSNKHTLKGGRNTLQNPREGMKIHASTLSFRVQEEEEEELVS